MFASMRRTKLWYKIFLEKIFNTPCNSTPPLSWAEYPFKFPFRVRNFGRRWKPGSSTTSLLYYTFKKAGPKVVKIELEGKKSSFRGRKLNFHTQNEIETWNGCYFRVLRQKVTLETYIWQTKYTGSWAQYSRVTLTTCGAHCTRWPTVLCLSGTIIFCEICF